MTLDEQHGRPELDYGTNILFLGAHCDDIEIGCGGTATKLSALGCKITFAVATNCGPHREDEAREAASKLGLRESDGRICFGGIPDGYLDQEKDELQKWLDALRRTIQPDTVFVHHPDNNSDHETLFKVAIRCFNEQTVLQYYVPQLDTRRTSFPANVTEDIGSYIETKLEMCACHKSQADKPIYLHPEVLRANALVFFVEAHSTPKSVTSIGYAEAFRVHLLRRPSNGFPIEISTAQPESRGAKMPESENSMLEHATSLCTLATSRFSRIRVFDTWHDSEIQDILSNARQSIEIVDSHYDEATDLVPLVGRALKNVEGCLEIAIHMLDPAKPYGAQRLLEKTGHAVRATKQSKEFEKLYTRTFAEDCKRLWESFDANRTIRDAHGKVRLIVYSYPTMPGIRLIAVDDSHFAVGWFPLNDTNPNYPCLLVSAASSSALDQEVVRRLRQQIDEVHQDRVEIGRT
ncbi:MAG TPA: PIG-L deacetylase family protein [Terriglobales bacterium]|nr:PIG-L deacetylase family protein [Terriglobales bacterium]